MSFLNFINNNNEEEKLSEARQDHERLGYSQRIVSIMLCKNAIILKNPKLNRFKPFSLLSSFASYTIDKSYKKARLCMFDFLFSDDQFLQRFILFKNNEVAEIALQISEILSDNFDELLKQSYSTDYLDIKEQSELRNVERNFLINQNFFDAYMVNCAAIRGLESNRVSCMLANKSISSLRSSASYEALTYSLAAIILDPLNIEGHKYSLFALMILLNHNSQVKRIAMNAVECALKVSKDQVFIEVLNILTKNDEETINAYVKSKLKTHFEAENCRTESILISETEFKVLQNEQILLEQIKNLMRIKGNRDSIENNIDIRIPRYDLKVYPTGCDKKKCRNKIREFYEMTRARSVNYAFFKQTGKVSTMDMLKRLGNNYDLALSWFDNAELGEVMPYDFEMPYDSRVMHSFANETNQSQILRAGTTHVAVGFNDLEMFHMVVYKPPISKQNPLNWIGYEASAYCVAKTSVILTMLKNAAPVDHVLQVWYSASWSYETLNSFRNAIELLVKNDQNITGANNQKVKALLMHWQKSDNIKLSVARKEWLESITEFWLQIGNFTNEADRQALLAYAISGEFLKGEVGSITMFSMPLDYNGVRSLNESAFQAIGFVELMKRRLKCDNIVTAAIEYLRDGIQRLRTDIMNKALVIDLRLEVVSISNLKALADIKSLNPYSISWSNVSDFCSPHDFHKMARSCSVENTVHLAYTMNWVKRVKGASVLDYNAASTEGKKYLDTLVRESNEIIKKDYEKLGCSNLLLVPVVDDPRNLIEFSLDIQFRMKWVDYFFSFAGIDKSKQLKVRKSYNYIFSRTFNTIYFGFTYNPEITLV